MANADCTSQNQRILNDKYWLPRNNRPMHGADWGSLAHWWRLHIRLSQLFRLVNRIRTYICSFGPHIDSHLCNTYRNFNIGRHRMNFTPIQVEIIIYLIRSCNYRSNSMNKWHFFFNVFFFLCFCFVSKNFKSNEKKNSFLWILLKLTEITLKLTVIKSSELNGTWFANLWKTTEKLSALELFNGLWIMTFTLFLK